MPRRPNPKNIPGRLVEETDLPLLMVDASCCISYANSAFGELVRLSVDELIGRQLIYGKADSFEDDQEPDSAQPDSKSSCISVDEFCPPPRFLGDASPRLELTIASPDATAGDLNIAFTKLPTPKGSFHLLGVVTVDRTPAARELKWTSDQLHQRVQEHRLRQGQRFRRIPFLGTSSEAIRCFHQAQSFALVNSNVVVVGVAGSQLLDVARAIHYSGFTSEEEPEVLLPIDCEVVGNRVEQIIVNHLQVQAESGARPRASILLINANHLTLATQMELSSLMSIPDIDLRWICTAPESLLNVEGFDSRLANQLSTLELNLPPLKNRHEDIAVLAQAILEAEDLENNRSGFTERCLRALQTYTWPGDYQELNSVVSSASKATQGPEVDIDALPYETRLALKTLANPKQEFEPIELDQFLSEVEAELIQRALKATYGNKTNAARLLGITRARMHRKLDFQTDKSKPEDQHQGPTDSDEEKES